MAVALSGITPFQPIYLIYSAICLSGILPVMPAPRRVRKSFLGKRRKYELSEHFLLLNDMSNLVIYVYLLYFVVVKIHEILDPTA